MIKKTTFFKSYVPYILGVLVVLLCQNVQAQTTSDKNKQKTERETNKLLQNAEKQLGENDFSSAEASYRKAISKNPNTLSAPYNMANMYYSKEKPSAASNRYTQAAKVAETKQGKHKVFHNLGNSYMDQKKYQEAVSAYENALRNDPSDDQTRYNLALAKKMLEKKKNKGGGNDKNKDQNKDQNKKDQDKKNQGDKDKKDNQQGDNKKQDEGGDKKDDSQKKPENPDDKGQPKDKPKDQKKEEGKNGNEKENEPQQGQQQKDQLSPQQIKSLLEAMNNEEKKVQDKINAHKAKGAKTKTDKDW